MNDFRDALAGAGGTTAPRAQAARLAGLLAAELERGRRELAANRTGRRDAITVAFAAPRGELAAVAPVDVALRADPAAVPERAWLVCAAIVGALAEVTGARPAAGPADLAIRAGSSRGLLALAVPVRGGDPELAELAAAAFDEHVGGIDRLRATAVAVPDFVLPLADLRPPIGAGHPLRVAEVVARLGARPAHPESFEAHEEAALEVLAPPTATVRAHDDPHPPRRIARRILQRLDGMGKWGGYHTAFEHLARGFEGDDRARAAEVGELLLAAGLLEEKRSVGQRHVFLNPRRSGEVRDLIEAGAGPDDPSLRPLRD